METLPIIMLYGGEWKVEPNGEHVYVGGDAKALTVERNCTLDEFISLICGLMDWDLSVMNIILRAKYNIAMNAPPLKIETDSDFRFFINDNIRHPLLYTPIVVTFEERHSRGNDMGNVEKRHRISDRALFRSASGSNQLSTPTPVLNHETPENERTSVSCMARSKQPILIREEPVSPVCGPGMDVRSNILYDAHHLDNIQEFVNIPIAYEQCPNDQYPVYEQHDRQDQQGDDTDNSDAFGYVRDPNFTPVDEPVEGPACRDQGIPFVSDQLDGEPAGYNTPVSVPLCSPIGPQQYQSGPTCPSGTVRLESVSGQPFTSSFQWIPPLPPSSSSHEDDANSFTSDMLNANEIGKGSYFKSKIELKEKLAIMALHRNFEFRVTKSSKTRFEVKCAVNNCKWRIRATKVPNLEYFRVVQSENVHTCSRADIHPHHKQASAVVLGKHIKEKFQSDGRAYGPKAIIRDVQHELHISISYNKAWRAKEMALQYLHGSPEESFNILPQYCYMLEKKNPGTVTVLDSDDANRFVNLFVAIGASISGFSSCIRPVISVDGSFLKGKYRGTMFIASCLEGNNQIYPLAFGVGHSENDQSWTWFMRQLRDHCCKNMSELAIISDRHPSIEHAVSTVFPEANHGLCTYHLKGNLKARFKDKKLLEDFEKTARYYLQSEFAESFEKIEATHIAAANYLRAIGFHKWARAHFPGRRYNVMTTNISESVNSSMRDARFLPISVLVEYYRATLQQWFYERRNLLSACTKYLTPAVDKILEDRKKLSDPMTVLPISLTMYEVRHEGRLNIVDMMARSCTCRAFDLDQLPCEHAFAAGRCMKLRNLDEYCSPLYTVERVLNAYAEPIYPVGEKCDWDVPDEVRNRKLLPPATRRPAGRPRRRRIPSVGETVRSRTCSRCGVSGHNRQTCQNPIALQDS